MNQDCPNAFSEEALKLIYTHLKQEEVTDSEEIQLKTAEIHLAFEENTCQDFIEKWIENWYGPLESNEKSEIENAIKKYLGSKLIGFTTQNTVVYLSLLFNQITRNHQRQQGFPQIQVDSDR
jgi:hypothetical protein